MNENIKPLYWVSTSLKDLKSLPEQVQDGFGYALHLAQVGSKHRKAKPLKGFSGGGVLEVVEDWAGNTFRAVYTVRFKDAIYVLHIFQKKSKSGISTPKQEINLIEKRLQKVIRERKN